MNRKLTITAKQLSAFLLLAVFLFTHAAKAFHTHEKVPQYSTTAHQLEKSNECPVCDYQLAKDNDHQPANFSALISPTQTAVYSPYQSRCISSVGLSYSDRGPPSLS